MVAVGSIVGLRRDVRARRPADAGCAGKFRHRVPLTLATRREAETPPATEKPYPLGRATRLCGGVVLSGAEERNARTRAERAPPTLAERGLVLVQFGYFHGLGGMG